MYIFFDRESDQKGFSTEGIDDDLLKAEFGEEARWERNCSTGHTNVDELLGALGLDRSDFPGRNLLLVPGERVGLCDQTVVFPHVQTFQSYVTGSNVLISQPIE